MNLNDLPKYKVHLLAVGNSGSGKTGSLAALVKAGFRLKIADFDNGVQILRSLLTEDERKLVEVEQFSPQYSVSSLGAQPEKIAQLTTNLGRTLDRWTRETTDKDIIIIDSLTGLGRLFLAWSREANKAVKHKQIHYGNAQSVIEPIIEKMSHELLPCHSIVLTHVNYRNMGTKEDPVMRGFISSVGSALEENDRLPSHYNEIIRYETIGKQNKIFTTASAQVGCVKTSKPGKLKISYPAESGLVEIFEELIK